MTVKTSAVGPPWLGQLFTEVLGRILGPVFVRLAGRLDRMEARVVESGRIHVASGVQFLDTRMADHAKAVDARLDKMDQTVRDLAATMVSEWTAIESRLRMVECLLRDAPLEPTGSDGPSTSDPSPSKKPESRSRFPFMRVPLSGSDWPRNRERLARQFMARHLQIERAPAVTRRHFRRLLPSALTYGRTPLYKTPAFQTALKLLSPPINGAMLEDLVKSYFQIPSFEKEVRAKLGNLIAEGIETWKPALASPAWLGAASTLPVEKRSIEQITRDISQVVSRLEDVQAYVNALLKEEVRQEVHVNKRTPRDARTGPAIEALFRRIQDLPVNFSHPKLRDFACETLGKPGRYNARWKDPRARAICGRWLMT